MEKELLKLLNKIINKKIILTLFISIVFLIIIVAINLPSKKKKNIIIGNIPQFNSTDLFNENNNLSNIDISQKITLINFFASWCVPCVSEHPLFFNIKKKFPNLLIIGINHKDKKDEAIAFIATHGNPYDKIVSDFDGKIAFKFGVLGLPETYLTNNNGKIIYKHAGKLTEKIIKKEIFSYLNDLK